MCWLTGYGLEELEAQLEKQVDFATVEAARFSALRWRVKEPTASARSRFA